MCSGGRSAANWRYKMAKKMRNRAIKFRDVSQNEEERTAWDKVVQWFSTIINEKRFITSEGSIGLRATLTEAEGEEAD